MDPVKDLVMDPELPVTSLYIVHHFRRGPGIHLLGDGIIPGQVGGTAQGVIRLLPQSKQAGGGSSEVGQKLDKRKPRPQGHPGHRRLRTGPTVTQKHN